MNSCVGPGTKSEWTYLLVKWKVGDVDFTDAFDLSWGIPIVSSVAVYDHFCVKVVYRSRLANTNAVENKIANFCLKQYISSME